MGRPHGRIARSVALYLNAQIDAGAQAVQLFDSWVGCLGTDDYRRYVLALQPYSDRSDPSRRAGDPFRDGQPRFDAPAKRGGRRRHRRRLADLRLDEAGRSVRAQGLGESRSGGALRTHGKRFAAAWTKCCRAGRIGRPGYIANLGHGVLPHTPLDNVLAMIDTVHAWKANGPAHA